MLSLVADKEDAWWLPCFRRVHKEELSVDASDNVLRALHAGIESGSENDLALYLADRLYREFRYSHDTKEKSMTLYRRRVGTTLWRSQQAESNLRCEARHAGLVVLGALLREPRWDPDVVEKKASARKMAEQAAKADEKTAAAKAKEGAREAKAALKRASSSGRDPPAKKPRVAAASAPPAEEEAVAQLDGLPVPETVAEERDSHFSNRMSKLRSRMQQTKPFNDVFAQVMDWLKYERAFLEPRSVPSPADFFKQLDASPLLLGFTNGIFVFDTKDVANFRFHPNGEGIPADRPVSMSTGYAYLGTEGGDPVTEEDRLAMEALEVKAFDKVFTDLHQRQAMKIVLGSLLIGGSALIKKLILLIGPGGNNGKSLLIKLLELVFGEYYDDLPYIQLTQVKTDGDGTNSVMCQVVKKRVVIAHEAGKAPLNESTVKIYTGGDSVKLRDMYAKASREEFFPKSMVVANVIPKVQSADEAMSNRLYPIDFTSTFSTKFDRDSVGAREFCAEDMNELVAYYASRKPLLMLMMLKFCKDFVSGTTTGKPLQLLPVAEDCQAAAALRDGSLGEKVRCWLVDSYVHTDGNFHDRTRTVDQLRRLVMNFEEVWRAFRNWAAKVEPDLHNTEKTEFEKLLRRHGVQGWKPVTNDYVAVRKGVQLWPVNDPVPAMPHPVGAEME